MFIDFESKNKETALFCRTIGSGEPILMIHGGGTDCDFFEKIAVYMSKYYEVTIYDRRGYGRNSAAVGGDYSIATQAKDAQIILQNIGKPAYVLAHSYGGLIAMELAKIETSLIKEFFIFEPPVYEGIDVKENLSNRADVLEMIKQEKYQEVISEFAKVMGPRDERSKVQTEEELQKTYLNLINFLKNELVLGGYSPEHKVLKRVNVTYCVGELSKETDIARGTANLAKKIDKKLIYFPGQHNSPYDLPFECACMFCGLLSL